MNNKEIYDRIELCEDIISLITNACETQAFILYSGTGIGKSSVSKKIAKMVDERKINKDIIRIKSAQNDNSQEGTFIKHIFQNIRKYYLLNGKTRKSKKKKYTYSYFIRHQNFAVIKKIIEYASLNVEKCKGISITIIQFVKLFFYIIGIKMGFVEELETNYADNKILAKYIKYILKMGNVVLCIENAQYFDKTSFDVLTELLIETKPCPNFFVFEFTLLDNVENLKFLNKIKDELDYSEIAYKDSELPKLDLKYVLELAKRLCNSADKSFVMEIERMYTGNVKKVENYAFNYSIQTVFNSDPTFELLQRLSNSQKYIMAIIILNNMHIKQQVLYKILNNSNDIYVSIRNGDIEYLIDTAELLGKRDNYLYIRDKDTIDSWNKNKEKFKMFEVLAYKNCEAIFVRILENGVEYSLSRRECIILLLQLYNRFDSIKLNTILRYVDEVIYDFFSMSELKKYLENLIKNIYLKEQSLKILYNIFDICYRYQLVDLESYCLDKINKIKQGTIDEKYLYCYFTNLLQREEYQFLLDKIKETKSFYLNLDFKYYIELFKIVAYASLNQTEQCQEIVNNLENDLVFHETLQYGYFLRLAEAYAKRNIAISKVEKSIDIFNKFSMNTQVAKSQVSLAFLYSITGSLEKAQIALDSAENILLKNIENKHVFNINKACLCLLNHNHTDEVWDLLSESEKYAHIRFDKIAIIINKLIWCIENKDFGKGKYYEKKGLELLELEYNHHLYAIFYYDCYVFYKTMGETEASRKYYNLAVNNKEYCDTLKARLEGKNEVEDQTTFLLQYPWHVCFVSYWYLDYIPQRENSLTAI